MKKAIFLLSLLAATWAPAATPLPETSKVGLFHAGLQVYSFNRFSLMEALDKTAQTGGKTVEFYPGQKIYADKDVKFNHNDASAEDIAAVKAKLAEKGLTPVGYGVVRLGMDEKENRKVFEFCKTMNIGVVVTEPDVKALDQIEALVKEFDIKMAIHNHPKRPLDRAYKFWDPNYVLELVKDRDPRMGACADIGHWVRSGLKPVDCIRILKGRIFDSHVKDLNAFGDPKAHDMPFGTGVSDIAAVLAEYHAQGFHGPLDIEYEYNWNDSVPDITKCIEFIKNWKPAN
jgi:sugar phosphate isomerase/epimerase